VNLAVNLANDKHFNSRIRLLIKEGRGALFEDNGVIREMEGFFEWAVGKYKAKNGSGKFT
jgi:hypothetical protein